VTNQMTIPRDPFLDDHVTLPCDEHCHMTMPRDHTKGTCHVAMPQELAT
jgi:hypothetical protein